jgi:hypothetical protein
VTSTPVKASAAVSTTKVPRIEKRIEAPFF